MKDLKKNEIESIKAKIRRDKRYKKIIDDLYKKNLKRIQREIERVVSVNSSDTVSIDDLKKRADADDVDYIEELFENYQKNDLNYYEKEQIKNTNINKRMSKLEYLYAFAILMSFRTSRKEESNLEKHLKDEIKEEKKRLEGDYGLKNLILLPDIIERFYKNKRYSDNIWGNQQDLVSDLKRGIRRSIYKGENPKKWSRSLNKNFAKIFKNYTYMANRIAVTETARIQIAYQVDSFTRNEYKRAMWICEPTACQECAPYDGVVFDIDSDHELPPQHPFCRCSIAPVYEYENS